jgi:type I restriction enzyme S subunit
MRRVRLGDAARFINGAAFKPTDWASEGLPIIRIQNLTGTGEHFNYTTRQVKDELVVEQGDLLVSWSATLDVYRWAGPRGLLNQHIFKVLPKLGVDPDFLFFALKSVISELESKTHGSTMKHVVRGDFEGTFIHLPGIDEQRRIVDLLSRAEGIARLRRQAQQKVAALIPTIFVDMFGDPATNPKGLDVVALGDVLASADYGSSAKAGDEEAGLPMIRMGNVDYSGNIDLAALKYVDLPPDDVARFGLKDGDILFNRTNSKELVGKTGLWIGDREAVLASYFIRLRVDERLARPFFVWAFMNMPHMKRVLFETARGAIGQANINSRELRAFRIPLPDLDEQARFESRCRDVLALRAQQRRALVKAEAAFQALLARAFSAPSQPALEREEATT